MLRRGFTLIELLVVIAIIAILAAILFPVFAQAREQAKKAQDISNFKQSSLGIFLYKDDNGNRCVPVNSWGFGVTGRYGVWQGPGRNQHDMPWPENVQPYVKSWHVFRCPVDPYATDEGLSKHPITDAYIPPSETALRHWAWAWKANHGLNFNWFSYSYEPCTATYGMRHVNWSEIAKPANTIMLSGSIWERQPNGKPLDGGNWAVDAPVIPYDPLDYTRTLRCWLGGWVCWRRYNGDPNSPECRGIWNAWGGSYPFFNNGTIFNVCYADGHAKGRKISQLLQGTNPRNGQILDAELCEWDTYK